LPWLREVLLLDDEAYEDDMERHWQGKEELEEEWAGAPSFA